MVKKCKRCDKEIQRSARANNVKYCGDCRKIAYKEKSHDRVLEWGRNRRGTYAKGKLECLICHKWYRKVLSHAWQCHGVLAHEYKEAYGIERGRGLIDDKQKEILREYVKLNAEVVIKKNLLKKGELTRFKKGDASLGKYSRREETLQRLKTLHKKRHIYQK